MAGVFSLRKAPLKKVPPLKGVAALGAKGSDLNKFFKRATPQAQAAAVAHAQGVHRGQAARGLVEMAAWQRQKERDDHTLSQAMETSVSKNLPETIAAVELSLRDLGKHSEKQIVQLCHILEQLKTKPDELANVHRQFEQTLRSRTFGRCTENDIHTLVALLPVLEGKARKRRRITATKPQISCHQRAALVWLSLHLEVPIAKVNSMFDNVVRHSTGRRWVTEKRFVEVWLPLVEKMKFSDVCARLASFRTQLAQLQTSVNMDDQQRKDVT